MKSRIERVQALLQTHDVEGFLVMSPENRRYLTGFTGTSGWVFITRNNTYFLTDFRYVQQAKEQVQGCRFVKFDQFSPELTLKQIADDEDIAVIGIESERVSLAQHAKLTTLFGRKGVVPVKSLIESLRMVKDEGEIACIAKAEAIGDLAFQEILKILKPGIREKDVALELEYIMKKNGASGLSFDSIIASGWRSALPHGVASDKEIAYGDMVVLDFGCVYEGYCSDMTRTVAIGKVDPEMEKIYNLVHSVQEEAIQAISAGRICQDIHQIAADRFTQAGYGHLFGHGLGHSIGLEIHEEPRFSPKDQTVLVENMVLTVEPGLYLPNTGGVRIEDVIVVKKDGIIDLTHSPKALIVV